MNYQFTRACIAFFIGENCDEDELKRTSLFPVGPSTAEAFRRNIERLLGLYHPNVSSVMLNLLGSHDMARFLGLARGDKSALQAGDPLSDDLSRSTVDLLRRRDRHDGRPRSGQPRCISLAQARNAGTGSFLHEFQRLIALRRQRPALRRGSFRFLWAADGVVAVARQLGDETIVAVFNASREARSLDLPLADLVADETVLTECWGSASARVEQRRVPSA